MAQKSTPELKYPMTVTFGEQQFNMMLYNLNKLNAPLSWNIYTFQKMLCNRVRTGFSDRCGFWASA